MFRSSRLLLALTPALASLAVTACGGASEGDTTDTAPQPEIVSAALVTSQTTELVAIQDARTQLGSGDVNFGSAQLWINRENAHYSFVEFDTSVLPPGAIVERAELVLHFTGHYDGDHTVEVGTVNGDWSETTITWNNQPAVTWGGPQTVVGPDEADVRWDVTELVTAWQNGSAPNEGFALRGAGDAQGKLFHSKDTSQQFAPKLVVTYRSPGPSGPLPDLGDAPDSSNHHGIVNTAYVGVPGQFPTVWNMAAAVAGPRHANQTIEAFLGDVITRENEADLGPDQDGPNNILRNALTGAVGDVADMDRGDDGWRNRNIRFFNCMRQTLQVRVTKSATAQRDTMYLNVWFDGTRDGDWSDSATCTPPSGGPPQPNFEWIVQNEPVDLTAIPAGGFADLNVDTERVLNITGGMPHWMRFTLSEAPAVQPPVGLPDGRGPHPAGALKTYQHGETEDIRQLPPPPGETGELVIEKRIVDPDELIEQGGTVRYQIKLRHEGGTVPTIASLRDTLSLPITELHLLTVPAVSSDTGGAGPLVATTALQPPGTHQVRWDGILAPDSEVELMFDVHAHVNCPSAFQQSKLVPNVARATGAGQFVSDQVDFRADCPGGLVAEPLDHVPNIDALLPFVP